jgi:hypothetical protein
VNPYDPPGTESAEESIGPPSHPAKPLLYVIGGFGVFQSIGVVGAALFVRLEFLGLAALMFAIGATGIYLGRQRFTRLVRLGTICWGVSTILLILVAVVIEPPSAWDVAGLVFIGLVLLAVVGVTLVAFQNNPIDCPG